jgi:uncharacterized protein
MNFEALERHVLQRLDRELPAHLHYHGSHHTRDVMQAAMTIADYEGIRDPEELTLLRTAALLHDSGFLVGPTEHEQQGADYARQLLPEYDYSPNQIETIVGMIMATKIPQSPHNLLEEILCDADLDYLGRPDFFRIGQTLFEELQHFGIIQSLEEWNALQVKFLTAHQYHTAFGKTQRQSPKQAHLAEVIKQLEGSRS